MKKQRILSKLEFHIKQIYIGEMRENQWKTYIIEKGKKMKSGDTQKFRFGFREYPSYNNLEQKKKKKKMSKP